MGAEAVHLRGQGVDLRIPPCWRRRLAPPRGGAGLGGGVAELFDASADPAGAGCGLLHVAGDLRGGGALLIHRPGDCGRDVPTRSTTSRYPAPPPPSPRGVLDLPDLCGDLLCRFGGLIGQAL